MKLLLDHCLPRRLAHEFHGHQVKSTGEMGWERLRNGVLLAAAADEGFDVFVTIDKKIKHEQNLAELPIAIIVILSVTNRLADLKPYMPAVEDAINRLVPRTLVEVAMGRNQNT